MKKEFNSEKRRTLRRDDAGSSSQFGREGRSDAPRRKSFNPNFDNNNRFVGGSREDRGQSSNRERSSERREGGFERREGGFGRERREGGFERRERSFDRNDRPARSNNFDRNSDRPARSFDRDSRPSREGSFNREDRPARSFERREGGFERNSDRPQRSFNREERPERRSFDRDSRPARSFDKDSRPERSFNRDSRPSREGSFGREDRPARNFERREGGFERREGGFERRERSFERNNDRPTRSFERNDRNGDRPQRFERNGDRPARNDNYTRRPSKNRENYPRYESKVSGDVRLNRYVANSGVCSRREADELIIAGVISVNGTVVTELGTRVKQSDVVRFNDEVIKGEQNVYIVMNKPKGYVTTIDDPHADKTVMDLLRDACSERIYPVGRLDKNSMGVLLFTNDGELTKKLTHPSYNKCKIYQVSLDRSMNQADMQKLADGVVLEDGEIAADEISYVGETKKEIGIEIHSGRNRIVRRMFDAVGYEVSKLDRVYFAGLTKKNLKRGAWRFLTAQEVNLLKSGQYR